MFRDVYGRLINYFVGLYLSAFEEAARRADAEIAKRLDEGGSAFGGAVLAPPKGPNPTRPAHPLPAPSAGHALLPQLPPIDHNTAAPTNSTPTQQPRRPRGRPRKEPPTC